MELGGAGLLQRSNSTCSKKLMQLALANPFHLVLMRRAADFPVVGTGARGGELPGTALESVIRLCGPMRRQGSSDDHNAFEVDEILDRLRLGQMITVMSGSMNDNVAPTFADIEVIENSFSQFSFCADDKHVGDLDRKEHIDHHIRKAILEGIPILEAYHVWRRSYVREILSIRPRARFYIPSKRADFVLINDLEKVEIAGVWLDGRPVYDADISSSVAFHNSDPIPDWLYGTFNLSESLSKETFRWRLARRRRSCRCCRNGSCDGYFKRAFEAELPKKWMVMSCAIPLTTLQRFQSLTGITAVMLALQALYADSVWNMARSPHRPTAKIKT